MHHADRRRGSNCPEYGVGNGVITAGADRYYARCLDLPIEGLDIVVLLFQVVPMRKAYITEIGNSAQLVRIDAQTEVKCPHEAGRVAYFARAVSCARPVCDPEISRDADQSDVHIFKCGCQRSTHEGCNLGIARLLHWVISRLTRNVRPDVTL